MDKEGLKKVIRKEIEDYADTDDQYGFTQVTYHTHNGTDSPLISQTASVNQLTAGTNIVLTPSTGLGNVKISSTGGGLSAGSNTMVVFNDNGTFGGKSTFTFTKASDTLAIPFINAVREIDGTTTNSLEIHSANGQAVNILGVGGPNASVTIQGASDTSGGAFAIVQGGLGLGTASGGGDAQVFGGDTNATNGKGGDAWLVGGIGKGTGNGGAIRITTGSKGASSSAGTLLLTIAGANFITSGMNTPAAASTLSVPVGKSSLTQVTMNDSSGTVTLNASTAGTAGQVIYVIVTNIGSADYSAIFNTNFLTSSAGNTIQITQSLSLVMAFISSGTAFYEISRSNGV